MTSRVIREEHGSEHAGRLREIIVSCDHMSCTTSLNDTTIRTGGGLKEMGWEATFADHAMRHYCPEHRRTKE